MTQHSNIPSKFLTDWDHPQPFGDLPESTGKVDSTTSMLRGWTNPAILDARPEAQVAEWNTVQAGLIELLARHSRAVARISVSPGEFTDWEGRPALGSWTGTGFLVAPNLLLTNHHVLNSPGAALHAEVQFDYQFSAEDLADGPPDQRPSSVNFPLNPDRLFITSDMQGFDFTFVWIDSEAARQFGYVPMPRGSFTIDQRDPTFILHHPQGQPKQASLDDTELLSINAAALLYAADTMPGSSGAPVFGPRGRLIGLHHASRNVRSAARLHSTFTGILNDGRKTQVVNEGIKLSAIALELEHRMTRGGLDADAAREVLGAFSGSDTLTGLFGGLGRFDTEDTGAYERVVQVYRGQSSDIDVGAWNIEWLSRRYDDVKRLRQAASVITDLNLDVWALSEVSPGAVKALAQILRDEFNQGYEYALSEPEASDGKQSTAVLWRPGVVHVTREEWPEEIDVILRARSDDELQIEAVHGRIFNRYPGLFRVEAISEEADKPLDFYLVPLHLKAKGEGSLRRRLASKVLGYAVSTMVAKYGADKDWILLGDMNAPLASGDFQALTDSGFAAMTAQDEKAGAITYLKAPYASLIDSVFLSSNMQRLAGQDDMFIVARDKVVDGFVQNISDHRPIALRLTLGGVPQDGDAVPLPDIDTLFQRLIPRAAQDAKQAAQTTQAKLAPNAASGSTAPVYNAPGSVPAPAISAAAAGTLDWVWTGLGKEAFLSRNAARITAEVIRTNAHLVQHFGQHARRISDLDAWALIYAEAGLTKAGTVDPGFVHSDGEYGILPLPRNIRSFWVGPSAPQWNAPMSLTDNVAAFLLYLGMLKNKQTQVRWKEGALYGVLFDQPGIAGQVQTEAMLLAGVVHGYFYKGNYRRSGGVIPFEQIIAGYVHAAPLDVIMAPTGYVHAGKPLMRNRQTNLDLAMRLYLSQ